MSLYRAQIISAALLVILAIIGILLVVLPAKEAKIPADNMYGIVLDAGSSHTSMYIYKWLADKQNGTGIVTQHSECDVKGGGISSYAGKPGGAAKSLEDCMEHALSKIPKSRQHQTPLCLGATAGMRLLNMVFVGRWLSSGRSTIGALDLGGASTQITFQTSQKLEEPANQMKLTLYGHTYTLYTQSFLCYGQDQFLRKLLAHLIQSQGQATEVFNPCYPRLFNISLKLGEKVFDTPCTDKYRPANLDPQATVRVVGTGDYQQCVNNVTEIFSFSNCNYSMCSFDGVFQPRVTGSFMAFSAFYFTQNYVKIITDITVTSPNDVVQAAKLICNMTITEIVNRTHGLEKYMKNVCAMANFVQILLTKGYRFDEASFPSISFKKTAGGASVGWALGYILDVSNEVPAEAFSVMKALPQGAWAGVIFLFIIFLFCALSYGMVIYRNR